MVCSVSVCVQDYQIAFIVRVTIGDTFFVTKLFKINKAAQRRAILDSFGWEFFRSPYLLLWSCAKWFPFFPVFQISSRRQPLQRWWRRENDRDLSRRKVSMKTVSKSNCKVWWVFKKNLASMLKKREMCIEYKKYCFFLTFFHLIFIFKWSLLRKHSAVNMLVLNILLTYSYILFHTLKS